MRELQQMDPAKAAALLKDADVEDAGSGRVAGVAVRRYRATVALEGVATSTGRRSQEQIDSALADVSMITAQPA